MAAGGENPVVQVEKGRWHSLECLEPDTVLFESKDGKYEPLAEEDITTNKKKRIREPSPIPLSPIPLKFLMTLRHKIAIKGYPKGLLFDSTD